MIESSLYGAGTTRLVEVGTGNVLYTKPSDQRIEDEGLVLQGWIENPPCEDGDYQTTGTAADYYGSDDDVQRLARIDRLADELLKRPAYASTPAGEVWDIAAEVIHEPEAEEVRARITSITRP